MTPELWGYKKLASFPWPVRVAAVAKGTQTIRFDLKDYLQKELISALFLRVVGSVVIAGAGAGVATGQDNPESLIVDIPARHSPTLGLVSKNAMTPRGIIQQGICDRGYSLHGTNIHDVAVPIPAELQIIPHATPHGRVLPA